MQAMVVRRYGPPEVFDWQERPDPVPAPGQVVIRVAAVGINFADLLARLGLYQGTPKPPFVPGLEVGGTVEQIGEPLPAGSSLRIGDRVAALTMFGGYAEKVAVPAEQAFRVPEGMPLEDAVAMPVNYLTAYHSMFYMGNLQPGDRILIHAAAGGVGVAAVQLARARKLVIFGTAGTAKQEFLSQIGVDHPIDYTREDFVRVVRDAVPDGIEMALDAIGGKNFRRSQRCLGPSGRLVVYGFSTVVGADGKRSYWRIAKGLFQTPRFRPLQLIGLNHAVIGVHIGRMKSRSHVLRPQMEEIFRMYAAGQVKPVIGKTFPLQQAAAAHRYIHERKNIGKVLLTVGGSAS